MYCYDNYNIYTLSLLFDYYKEDSLLWTVFLFRLKMHYVLLY